jgi:PTS system N-acetylglucosamine-specific IIC component
LIDYGLSYKLATNPLLVIPVGLVFAVVYYVLFAASIRALDLPTPGREGRDREKVSTSPGAEPLPA